MSNSPNTGLLTLSNTRFLKVMDEVLRFGRVDSEKEFAEVVGTNGNQIALMRKGVRNVTVEMISKVCKEYGADPAYLVYPFGKTMFRNNSNRIAELKREKKEIEKMIEILS